MTDHIAVELPCLHKRKKTRQLKFLGKNNTGSFHGTIILTGRFARINRSSLINTEKILNRPITYKCDCGRVTAH